jgi:chemotaxis response regulator CheB
MVGAIGSSVVWGMPGSAVATGHVDHVLSPGDIREKLIRSVGVLRTPHKRLAKMS